MSKPEIVITRNGKPIADRQEQWAIYNRKIAELSAHYPSGRMIVNGRVYA